MVEISQGPGTANDDDDLVIIPDHVPQISWNWLQAHGLGSQLYYKRVVVGLDLYVDSHGNFVDLYATNITKSFYQPPANTPRPSLTPGGSPPPPLPPIKPNSVIRIIGDVEAMLKQYYRRLTHVVLCDDVSQFKN